MENKVDLTLRVEVGDGAVMTIPNPVSYTNGGLEWQLRYGSPENIRFIAAEAISSYDYLLCGNISMAESTRRLRLMKKAYKDSFKPND